MALLLHIVIAFSSIVWVTHVLFSPTKTKITASYALIVSTIASGTFMVFLNPSYMLRACITGVAYTAVVIGVTEFSRRKVNAKKPFASI